MFYDKDGIRLYLDKDDKCHSASISKFSENIKAELLKHELKSLTVDTDNCIDDFSFISELKSLNELIIRFDYKKLIDISFVNKLSNLRDLGLPRFSGKIINKDLITLGYKWHKKSDISGCPNVKSIDVLNCADTKSFIQQISGFNNLLKLFFFRISSSSFFQTAELTSIEELEFSYCPKFENLEDLAFNFPKIKKIKFDHCKNIKDYSPLSKLKDLEELVILESAPIVDLSFLREIKKLTLLKVGKTKITAKNIDVLDEISAEVDLLFTGITINGRKC